MPPKIALEAASTHSFDIAHLRRSGGEELLGLLLEKAGFVGDVLWRARINEKQQCSGMTPPVSVTNYKLWGVYVRIKPGDNNTCHSITLIIPESFKSPAEAIYHKLKTAEKSFNRNWRKKEMIEVPVAAVLNGHGHLNGSSNGTTTVLEPPKPVHLRHAEPPHRRSEDEVITASMDDDEGEEKTNVVKLLKDVTFVKKVCLFIGNNEDHPFTDQSHYMECLARAVKIAISGRQGGAMMRSITGKGLVEKRMFGNIQIGYKLTAAGRELVKDQLPAKKGDDKPKATVPPKPACQPVNRSKLIVELGGFAQDLVGAANRLQVIAQERDKLMESVRALDKEESEICDILNSEEVEDILSKLVTVRMKGKT